MKGTRRIATLLVGFASLGVNAFAQTDAGSNQKTQPNWFTQLLQERSKAGMMADQHSSSSGSAYVPIDSWIYPALDRLQALGYVDFAYLGLRPWTRSSITHMLDQTERAIDSAPADEEAREIYLAVRKRVAGTPLNDSFHLGQTIVNDYGRPYQEGFNPISGFSARSEAGRFALYFRGEYQHAPGAPGYSPSLTDLLSTIDGVPIATNPNQATIPSGPIAPVNDFRIVEANISYLLLNHEFSFGKSDHWMGPAQGGSFAWSNNAENIYAFQIDRVEPLYVPLLSELTGPFRYQFFVGSLKGHTDPRDPWVHVEKISFKPTVNLEMGFERATIWGGGGHAPITIHTFLHSFFSFQNTSAAEKLGRDDPGARFGTFDFSYRYRLSVSG
jgi:Capsule assembly protein Wzi